MRIGIGVTLALFCICFAATPQETITVAGKLTRAMAIGGESTGWSVELDSETSIDGKPAHSVEVESPEIKKLETLENKHVRATGKVTHRQGVETGNRTVLAVSSIREVKAKPAPATAFSLANSEWLLKDLGGSEVLDNVQATLAFQETGKVSGNGSCNRFFGSAKINGNAIELGPLGATRMACPEAIMNQEAKYMGALQAADRFEWKAPYLLLHSKGFEKPLRFTRMVNAPR
ncbi:MAG TPA: META domain-containing protein [Bryobacteraceae bacterium]|jgi:heat shock protein HslJ